MHAAGGSQSAALKDAAHAGGGKCTVHAVAPGFYGNTEIRLPARQRGKAERIQWRSGNLVRVLTKLFFKYACHSVYEHREPQRRETGGPFLALAAEGSPPWASGNVCAPKQAGPRILPLQGYRPGHPPDSFDQQAAARNVFGQPCRSYRMPLVCWPGEC